MEIQILNLLSGAQKARGLTVIIDVFRAFSVEAQFFAHGGKEILAVASSEQAYRLKEQHPDYLLVGERHGKILPGFDCGNSPTDLIALDLRGKTMIHTTSSGTQGIENAKHATQILGGSLLTARKTASYIKNCNEPLVSLVCMVWEGDRDTEEDLLCAEYIKSLLEQTEFDLEKGIEDLKHTEGAKFFDKAKQAVFPETDFYLCTERDDFDFVICCAKSEDGIHYMKAIK